MTGLSTVDPPLPVGLQSCADPRAGVATDDDSGDIVSQM